MLEKALLTPTVMPSTTTTPAVPLKHPNKVPVVMATIDSSGKVVTNRKRSIDRTDSVSLLSRTFSTYHGRGVKVFVEASSSSEYCSSNVHWIQDEEGFIHVADTTCDDEDDNVSDGDEE